MISPKEALKRLIDGNERFASEKSIHPNLGGELRSALVGEQKPYATILSCSDSRVPVEIIFDAGIGDLFVIRSAGHVLSKETLGSIEYSVKNLGVKLIMVMGHGNCGAIKSALNSYNAHENNLSENLQALLSHIYPAFENLDCSDEKCDEKALLRKAIISNIKYQTEDLVKKDEYLAEKISSGEIMLVGAKYNLDSGRIEILQ